VENETRLAGAQERGIYAASTWILFGVRERLVGRKPKRRERRAPDAIQRFLN
jgi:hypothetical protein